MCDVAVIGGGPAGSVAAIVLARSGLRVTLIDRDVPISRRIGESLPGAARPLLHHLRLLPLVENGSHSPAYGNVFAWGSEKLDTTDFIRDPHGPGWHLDRVKFDGDLRAEAETEGVTYLRANVSGLRRESNTWKLKVGEDTIEARWLADATGRSACVARKIGAAPEKDDTLMAVYAWANPRAGDGDTRTLVESTPHGWWYTSRLADSSRVVAFHTDADKMRNVAGSMQNWERMLAETKHVKKVLGRSRGISNISATQAWGSCLPSAVGDGWLAVGDAALAFDPLSSQGIFNAIYTGMKGAQAVVGVLENDPQSLPRYADRLRQIRLAYLVHHRQIYCAERRWPTATFWKRRQKRMESFPA